MPVPNRHRWIRRLATLALVALPLAGAGAQDLPKTELKAVGYTSNLYLWLEGEKQFYAETIPQASGGQVTIEAVPHDLAGIKGPEVMRLLADGVLQIANQNISYMAGDDPRFEGPDLAAITLTTAEARQAADAYRPVIARVMEEKFNSKLLGLGPSPAQVFWCRVPITGLADFKGKKIRVFNKTLTDFVAGAGGTTVTIPFVEMIPAMQRGIADCAVTGTLNGNYAKLGEVTTTLFPLTVGWSMVFWAANQDVWDGLDPKVQAFLEEQYRNMEDLSWKLGAEADAEGISCSTGGPCTRGVKNAMTLVPVSDADKAERTRILNEFVLPEFAKRCGAECAAEWNETVGKALGLTAPAG